MRLTENNARAAVKIMEVLAENKCAIADITGIFSYVELKIRDMATAPSLDYDALLKELTSNLVN
ncbi:MAG: hypothetical protein NC299_12890 [Lachnospiraceae bacterium]|nr:hypothetical protein [Lachnospiraceae bacterium]